MKKFPRNVVLTVVRDTLLCDIRELYLLLNYMTGECIFTHQIPRVRQEAAKVLGELHPTLLTEDVSGINSDNFADWLSKHRETYPYYELDVPVMTVHQHEYRDPASELAEKVHPSKIKIV